VLVAFRVASLEPSAPCPLKGHVMHLVCSDLEGVFLPEIWIKFAEKTGIQ
jgi:hypothetical protein